MFTSREDAGRKLGDYLREEGITADLVLGLPRGGVVVAAGVADVLHVPLDVLIVRKIGHPWHREFAIGALGEGDVVVLDEGTRASHFLLRSGIREVIDEERRRLREYEAKFHPFGAQELASRQLLIVDDGLATGATAEAAVLVARKKNARRILVAAPVASANAVQRLQGIADDVIVMLADPEFEAVGRYYETFSQTTDEEVAALLKGHGATLRE